MRIRKAVITAAGRGTRHYPATQAIRKELFPLVCPDGVTRSVIHLIVDEALASGIEEVCIVTDPGGDADFRKYFKGLGPADLGLYSSKPWALEESKLLEEMGKRISYAVQEIQEGYGHAVYCARDFVGDEPFLLMLGDHIYTSSAGQRCAKQLVCVFNEFGISSAAVAQTPAELLHLFGTVTGTPVQSQERVYRLTRIVEKPSVEYARENMTVPGLAADKFLCFFGIQCLTPGVFDCLEYHIKNDIREKGEIQLTSSLEMLRAREGFLAVEVRGERHDVGVPDGYAETVKALTSDLTTPMAAS